MHFTLLVRVIFNLPAAIMNLTTAPQKPHKTAQFSGGRHPRH